MSKLESMQGAAPMVLLAAAFALHASGAPAHHNSQAEFGAYGSNTIAVEGTIVDIHWSNPHISIDIRTTGGELPAGQNWRLVSHPVQIMNAYGFVREEFAVGDSVKPDDVIQHLLQQVAA